MARAKWTTGAGSRMAGSGVRDTATIARTAATVSFRRLRGMDRRSTPSTSRHRCRAAMLAKPGSAVIAIRGSAGNPSRKMGATWLVADQIGKPERRERLGRREQRRRARSLRDDLYPGDDVATGKVCRRMSDHRLRQALEAALRRALSAERAVPVPAPQEGGARRHRRRRRRGCRHLRRRRRTRTRRRNRRAGGSPAPTRSATSSSTGTSRPATTCPATSSTRSAASCRPHSRTAGRLSASSGSTAAPASSPRAAGSRVCWRASRCARSCGPATPRHSSISGSPGCRATCKAMTGRGGLDRRT